MDRESVMKHVVRAVEKVQEISGREIGTIDPDTKPIGDTTGFDSLNGMEVTVALTESLDHEFPNDNIFVSKDGRKALTISEVVDNLCKTIRVEN